MILPRMRAITPFTPTRTAALGRLAAFVPSAGRAYAANRNVDRGPDDRSNVSALSPYLRRRMITEEEVVRHVLGQHRFADAEKFVQEVAWRTYWKGWLELRPAMFARYEAERQTLLSQLGNDRALARRHAKAIAGETGIACFDAWVAELVTHGWLHNHTRMWFASIWIFTLRLPWQLGADFLYTHLLDADPASNTLSWRWVAGLHTRGKHYLARAENIDRNTLGRFAPYGALNEQADPLPADEEPPPPMALRALPPPPRGRVALLVTEEDLHPESWTLAQSEVAAIAVLPTACSGDAEGPAMQFSRRALEDAARRATLHFGVEAALVAASDVPAWITRSGLTAIVTAEPPVGAIAKHVQQIGHALDGGGIALHRLRRDWDQALWPLATAGFFKLKSRLPSVISSITAG